MINIIGLSTFVAYEKKSRVMLLRVEVRSISNKMDIDKQMHNIHRVVTRTQGETRLHSATHSKAVNTEFHPLNPLKYPTTYTSFITFSMLFYTEGAHMEII